MATLAEFLARAQAYLTAQNVTGMDRNQLLAHGALERMAAELASSPDLIRYTFDSGSLIRAAGQDKPWGTGRFRVFYTGGNLIVPAGVESLRVTVASGSGSGAGPLSSTGADLVEGQDGGTSSVVGTGIAISATGGGGGNSDGTGGAGGVGAGGDTNYTGGSGGSGAIDGDAAAGGGGGGSATHWGNGGDGGNAYAEDTVSAAAGGGGSVFAGGDGSAYGSGAGASAYGAGTTPDATTITNAQGGPDCIGAATASGVSVYPFDTIVKMHPFDGFWYAGGYGLLNSTNGKYSSGHGGAGGGARSTSGNHAGGYADSIGPGGGGGASVRDASGGNKYGGYASPVGGGGGGGGVRGAAEGVKGGGGGGGCGYAQGVFDVDAGLALAITVGLGGGGHHNNGGRGGNGFILIEY